MTELHARTGEDHLRAELARLTADRDGLRARLDAALEAVADFDQYVPRDRLAPLWAALFIGHRQELTAADIAAGQALYARFKDESPSGVHGSIM